MAQLRIFQVFSDASHALTCPKGSVPTIALKHMGKVSRPPPNMPTQGMERGSNRRGKVDGSGMWVLEGVPWDGVYLGARRRKSEFEQYILRTIPVIPDEKSMSRFQSK